MSDVCIKTAKHISYWFVCLEDTFKNQKDINKEMMQTKATDRVHSENHKTSDT